MAAKAKVTMMSARHGEPAWDQAEQVEDENEDEDRAPGEVRLTLRAKVVFNHLGDELVSRLLEP